MKHRVILFLALLAASLSISVAETLEEAATRLMKARLTQYAGTRFGQAVALGDVGLYEGAIKSVKIKVDPALTPLAVYDSETETISLSRDPRTITTAGELQSFSDTIWHEVTHRLEHQNGDFKADTTEAYDERNVTYMTYLYDVAFPKLREMEDRAKAGTPSAELQKFWDGFLKNLEDAKSVSGVPVDPRQLRSYFGFEVDLGKLETLYLLPETHPAIREALGGIAAKPVIPKGGAWVLTQVINRPAGGMSERDFEEMERRYADSDAQVRGRVRVGSSLFTFKVGERYYALGTEWSRPKSLMKPGEALTLTAKASDKGCQNTPEGDGTFVAFDVSLWGNSDGPSWYGHAINLGTLYGNPKKDSSKTYKITFPQAKVKHLHLVVGSSGVHWGREVVYMYEWRDR